MAALYQSQGDLGYLLCLRGENWAETKKSKGVVD